MTGEAVCCPKNCYHDRRGAATNVPHALSHYNPNGYVGAEEATTEDVAAILAVMNNIRYFMFENGMVTYFSGAVLKDPDDLISNPNFGFTSSSQDGYTLTTRSHELGNEVFQAFGVDQAGGDPPYLSSSAGPQISDENPEYIEIKYPTETKVVAFRVLSGT